MAARQNPLQARYDLWQGQISVLYDTIAWRYLRWPSLTVQWLPGVDSLDDAAGSGPHFECQRLLLGTQTSGQEDSELLVYKAALPATQSQQPAAAGAGGGEAAFNQALVPLQVEVEVAINHGGVDVNRARASPHNPDLVATRSDSPEVLLFQLSVQLKRQQEGEEAVAASGGGGGRGGRCEPDCVLGGGAHSEGGFGLAWNPGQQHPQRLVTCGTDGGAAVWQLGEAGGQRLAALQAYRSLHGSGAANGADWHPDGTLFATVGDDGGVTLVDSRQPPGAPLAGRARTHRGDALAVAWEPGGGGGGGGRLVTGGADGVVCLLDARQLRQPLARLEQHAGDVAAVAWCGRVPGVFASCGEEGFVVVWDAELAAQGAPSRDGAEAAQDAAGKAGGGAAERRGNSRKQQRPSRSVSMQPAPGVLFVHAGHLSGVADVGFSAERPWQLATVSPEVLGPDGAPLQHSIMQVWQPMKSARLEL